MAEIRVQTKKNSPGSMWIWVLAVLLIAAAVVYYLMTRNKTADNVPAKQPDAAMQTRRPAFYRPVQPQPVVPIVYAQSL